MTLENDISLLAKIEFFQDFTPEQLRLVAFGSQKRSLHAGTELFQQGDKTDCGYAVLSGCIELATHTNNQREILGLFPVGSLIGEIALITENERVGTAIVAEDTSVLRIPRAVIRRIFEEYPALAVNIHKRLTGSVLETLGELEELHPKLGVGQRPDGDTPVS